ncbi:hypothetical protein Tco_1476410 [Tanacetum coccineum]
MNQYSLLGFDVNDLLVSASTSFVSTNVESVVDEELSQACISEWNPWLTVLFTSEAWKRAFDINEPIYTELCHEFYATFEFDEVVADDELMMKKAIKFRLCGKAYAMSILDFAKRLGLYTDAEIQEYGFETYFIGGLRNDDDFSADQYWLNISSEETLTLSRSSAKTIRKPVLIILQKMITYGLCQRTTGYDKDAGWSNFVDVPNLSELSGMDSQGELTYSQFTVIKDSF